jgi:hypothetical protein
MILNRILGGIKLFVMFVSYKFAFDVYGAAFQQNAVMDMMILFIKNIWIIPSLAIFQVK